HIDNNDFRNFINECWNNRYSIYDDSNLLNENNDNREQRFLTFDGNKIKARNYIGFINYEDEEITIYPKIFDKEIVNENLDNYLLTNLMYWLRDSEKIKLPLVESSLDFRDNDDFIEIFIYLFAKYTLELIDNKHYNTYEEVEEELEFLKGRLNTNTYLKENLSTGRWNKFNCTYEPYLYNNKFNQIIKYVSKMLILVSKKEETLVMLNNISFILDEVDDITCTIYDCNEVKLNRLQEDYNIV
ncbi:MAG: 5-methylcytosine restriction system specificity protein McrC, partial [Romboutsia timonensis]|uniref:5-methylcytosine restriction system specificity protein McrC n=1 Tax=Romboutsia timonensis TaxID=1776391 RepID=UPI0039923E83